MRCLALPLALWERAGVREFSRRGAAAICFPRPCVESIEVRDL